MRAGPMMANKSLQIAFIKFYHPITEMDLDFLLKLSTVDVLEGLLCQNNAMCVFILRR